MRSDGRSLASGGEAEFDSVGLGLRSTSVKRLLMISNLPTKLAVRNSILTALSLSDFGPIRCLLEPVSLERGVVLHEPNKRIEYVSFVETGMVSLMTIASGSMLETAMVGCHGVVGASVVLGTEMSMHKSVVSIPGRAHKISVVNLRRSISERPQIREHLLRYLQSLMIHCSQTALCGVRHELEQRLASWLCLACDAVGSQTLPLTHDRISFILGLRRAGVTESLNRFEELGWVRKTRGVLHVCERQLLQQRACCCCGSIAGAYGWIKSSMPNSYEAHQMPGTAAIS